VVFRLSSFVHNRKSQGTLIAYFSSSLSLVLTIVLMEHLRTCLINNSNTSLSFEPGRLYVCNCCLGANLLVLDATATGTLGLLNRLLITLSGTILHGAHEASSLLEGSLEVSASGLAE